MFVLEFKDELNEVFIVVENGLVEIIVMFKWFVMMLFIKDKWLLLVVVLIEKNW